MAPRRSGVLAFLRILPRLVLTVALFPVFCENRQAREDAQGFLYVGAILLFLTFVFFFFTLPLLTT